MANPFSPKYLAIEDIKLYLANKIEFSNIKPNAISDSLLSDIICQAESSVERDLSMFYVIPFQTNSHPPLDWTFLPATSYNHLRELLLAKTMEKVARFQFARNDNTVGEGLIEHCREDYLDKKNAFYMRKPNGVILFSPLPGLALSKNGINYNNNVPIPRSQCIGPVDALSFAASRVTNPSLSPYWFGFRPKNWNR